MKTIKNYAVLFIMGMVTLFSTTSCEELEEWLDDKDGQTTYRYWKKYPNSYIQTFDGRMTFRLLSVKRNGTSVQIDYNLTNTGFNRAINAVFVMPEVAGHDDLGNAYKCAISEGNADILSFINGGTFSIYGWGRNVIFKPNQTIKGSFTIKNFDINATMVSITCGVSLNSPTNTAFTSNTLDFVNIPVDEENTAFVPL
ncbi:MAG: hypothetical protein IKC18_03040 [Bacteroidaceae bacterium]|nr:hypothetical protein [Bacteroidaceae bacterium]